MQVLVGKTIYFPKRGLIRKPQILLHPVLMVHDQIKHPLLPIASVSKHA